MVAWRRRVIAATLHAVAHLALGWAGSGGAESVLIGLKHARAAVLKIVLSVVRVAGARR